MRRRSAKAPLVMLARPNLESPLEMNRGGFGNMSVSTVAATLYVHWKGIECHPMIHVL